MTSIFARHEPTPLLAPFRYAGDPVPPRADGLAAPLPRGTTVYLDANARRRWDRYKRGFDRTPERTLVTVHLRDDGKGATFAVRAIDLRWAA